MHGRTNTDGAIQALRKSLKCSHYMAARVVKAVDTGTENELLKIQRRKTSVTKDLVDEMVDFFSQPHISRPVPGRTVSVGYRKRETVQRLLVSKETVLREFRTNLPRQYSIRTLMRYVPKQFRVPRGSDRTANCCPTHDNFPRLLEALQKKGICSAMPTSCRAACFQTLCDNDGEATDPGTWPKACAMNECKQCSTFKVAEDPQAGDITFFQWRSGPTGRFDKKGKEYHVFSLHDTTSTIAQAVKNLEKQVINLRRHIFTAYSQWRAKKICEENLRSDSLMLCSDYQQNISVALESQPTGSVFGGNTVQVAVFPIVAYFKHVEGGPTKKAEIIFVSDDLGHDREQIQVFFKRTVEILEEKLGRKFTKLHHWSDGCASQYRSQYVNADIAKMSKDFFGLSGCEIVFHYFESNEGKSESDTCGSNFKGGSQKKITFLVVFDY